MVKARYYREDINIFSDRILKPGDEIFVFDRFNYVNQNGYEDIFGAIISHHLDEKDVCEDLYEYFEKRIHHKLSKDDFLGKIKDQMKLIFDGKKLSIELWVKDENNYLTTWCEVYRAKVV
tara:strand:+ start:4582 stop:4941 length:360 start_codon:yes stop_codon:yes gene_type:complete